MSVPFSLTMLVLLLVAAWRDIATRTIPNTIGLLLVAAGVFARTLDGPTALAFSAGSALLLFALLLILYSRGLLGGGDVKLMTAIAVGLSPVDCYRFVIATALAGGVLAIVYLVLSLRLRGHYQVGRLSFLNRVGANEAWRIRRRASLPYGVAIAAGAAFVRLHAGRF